LIAQASQHTSCVAHLDTKEMVAAQTTAGVSKVADENSIAE
jgi:hypothetical protein